MAGIGINNMKRIITKQDKKSLSILKIEAKQLQDKLDRLVEKAEYITGEDVEGGHTFDFMLNDVGTAEELLDRLEVTVSDTIGEGFNGATTGSL